MTFDDEYEHELSADYIGPSRAWARKFIDEDISTVAKITGDFLLVTRTIGGHVFWPAHRIDNHNTINQVRGGRGIYDRFDITLAELRNYYRTQIECPYENKKDSCLIYKPLYEAFKRYKWFFREYGTFINYVNKMNLAMFLHDGEIFSLVDSDVEKKIYKPIKSIIPKDYLNYIKNCKYLIALRTKEILEKLGEET